MPVGSWAQDRFSSSIRTASLALSRVLPLCDPARPSGVCPRLALPSASSTSFHFGHLLLFGNCFHHHHFTELSLGQELSAGANRASQSCPSLLGNETPESDKLFGSRLEPKRTWRSNHTAIPKESIFHNMLCGQNCVLGAQKVTSGH